MSAPTLPGRVVDALLTRIGAMPTTNVRIAVTLGLMVATGIVYLVLAVKSVLLNLGKSWAPTIEWLGFLLASAGIDAVQFTAKRLTAAEYVAAKTPAAPDST